MLCRVGAADRVNLRERAEAARAANLDLVAALHFAFDLAFDRESRLVGALELLVGGRAARQAARQHDAAGGGDDQRLDGVADGDFKHPLVVLQFGNLDHRLALTADVHEGGLVAEADDGALDRLALFNPLRLERSLEHGGEIFFELAHGALSPVTRLAPRRAAHPPIISGGRILRSFVSSTLIPQALATRLHAEAAAGRCSATSMDGAVWPPGGTSVLPYLMRVT